MKLPTLCRVLLLPLTGQAALIQTSASAGDSAALIATCLAGAQPYGTDVRGCSDGTGQLTISSLLAVPGSDAWAMYANGLSSRAIASATPGTWCAFATTQIPAGDALGHNLESQACADFQDTLLASSACGTLVTGYRYNVVNTGSATPGHPVHSIPGLKSDAYVPLNIRFAATGEVLVETYWECNDLALGSVSISGSSSGVAAGTPLSREVFIQTDSGVFTTVFGDGVPAQADHSSTVQFDPDALTPDANTVSTGGWDCATPAPAPEPASAWAPAAGPGPLAMRRRR